MQLKPRQAPPSDDSRYSLATWPQFVRRFAARFPLGFDLSFALLTFLVAFLFATSLPTTRRNPLFVFFTVGIACATWIAGRRSGIMAFLLTASAAIWLLFLPHGFSQTVNEGLLMRVLANLAVGSLAVAVVSRLRASEYRNHQLLASETRASTKAESAHKRAVDILESITDAFCSLDSQWRFTYVNQRTVRELGRRSASDLIGRNIWEEFPGDIHVREQYAEVMRTRIPAHFESHFHATNSWLSVDVYPAPDDGLSIFFRDITARRQTDARIKSFYQSEIVGVMSWKLDGSILEANDKFLQMVGYTRDELLAGHINWFAMTPPEFRELDEHAIQELRTRGIDTPHEKEFFHKNGSHIPVLVGAAMLEDTSDEAIAFVLDISNRKSTENALRDTEERFRFLVDNIPQVVWTATPDGKQDFANTRWYTFSGVLPGADLSADYRLICHPDDLDMTERLWAEALRTGRPYNCLHRIRRHDGVYRWVLSRAVPQTDSAGRIVRWFGTGTDITDLRLAEEKLRESESRFRAVAENIPQMIWVATVTTEFKYLSKRWLDYTGTTIEESQNGGWTKVIHPDDLSRAAELWNRATTTNSTFEIEYRIRRHDGQYRWHLSRAVPIEGDDTRLWFGSTTDIEDQKKAQVALIRSEKLASVGRLAATVAHEINNPLEAIMNVVYLASVDSSLSDEGKQLLVLAQQELMRVAHITRQTLGFYRESGTAARVNLPDVVDGVVDLLGPRLRNKGVRVVRDYRQAPPVYAFRGELFQVLSNLIGNAMDAMPNGSGSIRIRISPTFARRTGHSVRLTISDSGTGIDPKVRPHIFEPFFTTKESFGTGLGLWVSKGIMEKHNGSISVRSTLGKGTTFSVVLPTEQQPVERTA